MECPDGAVVASLMPQLRSELELLVRIPSIAFPGFPPEPLFEAHDQVAELLRGAGVKQVGRADSKADLVSIIGALRASGGRPPVGVEVVFEGQEEHGSPFDYLPPTDPGRFQAAADDSWRPEGGHRLRRSPSNRPGAALHPARLVSRGVA